MGNMFSRKLANLLFQLQQQQTSNKKMASSWPSGAVPVSFDMSDDEGDKEEDMEPNWDVFNLESKGTVDGLLEEESEVSDDEEAILVVPDDFPEELDEEEPLLGTETTREARNPVEYRFLKKMPFDVMDLFRFFWQSFHVLVPTIRGYRLPHAGGLSNDLNFEERKVWKMVIDDAGKGWVQFHFPTENTIVWYPMNEALAFDRVQVVYQVMKRGYIFHDKYWWFVRDYTDLFMKEGENDYDDEVIDLVNDDSDDDEVEMVG